MEFEIGDVKQEEFFPQVKLDEDIAGAVNKNLSVSEELKRGIFSD